MKHKSNQLIQRIARLVQENKDLSDELRSLRVRYEELLLKNEEYENFASKFKKPKEVLERPERTLTQKFNMVTVLYANIHGFNEISPKTEVEQLIDQLDQIYIKFDLISQNYNIHKIKTIGDSFMCAGGIPHKNITNPIEVLLAAYEMLNLVTLESGNNGLWKVRIAVHTGPVTAFVNGKSKVTYDIKGDTVNIVSRMESSGKNGKLLVSVMTYELIKEFFVCQPYSFMPVKYKGKLELYEVIGIKPELSENGIGLRPNKDFKIKFDLIQFHDLQEYVLDILEKELPRDLHYHNLKHTVDVVTEVELIGWAEGISDEELLLVKTAALFHDFGHTRSYTDHEYHGTELARKILPDYGYSKEQIERICELIMATKMPPSPKSLLEEIICDADLDYLGRSDFIPVSNALFEELKNRNIVTDHNEWNKKQLEFISGHQYFTETAQKLREVNKLNQIERIRQIITF